MGGGGGIQRKVERAQRSEPGIILMTLSLRVLLRLNGSCHGFPTIYGKRKSAEDHPFLLFLKVPPHAHQPASLYLPPLRRKIKRAKRDVASVVLLAGGGGGEMNPIALCCSLTNYHTKPYSHSDYRKMCI